MAGGSSWPERADAVRLISLEEILLVRGARRDVRDKHRWLTDRGPISIAGPKFMNWQSGSGGGGAIDLVIHLDGATFEEAVQWLERQFLGNITPTSSLTTSPSRVSATESSTLRLPNSSSVALPHVVDYLVNRRHLREEIVAALMTREALYADQRHNAVFVMVRGRANTPVGAELRGTSSSWRGMARGSTKDAGYFWVGASAAERIVLCESAIDAISCYQLLGSCLCISTAGARSDAPWIPTLLKRGYAIYNGFDADDRGGAAAAEMLRRHPLVRRLKPPAKDWNDALHRWS